MRKVIARGIFAVAFLGMSLLGTGLQGVSIQGHEVLGSSNSAMAMKKSDPNAPVCRWVLGDVICLEAF